MSKSKIHICKCDRCGEETRADTEHNTAFYKWGYVWFAQNNGPIYGKSKSFPSSFIDCYDLCEECMTELDEWYNKPKTDNF